MSDGVWELSLIKHASCSARGMRKWQARFTTRRDFDTVGQCTTVFLGPVILSCPLFLLFTSTSCKPELYKQLKVNVRKERLGGGTKGLDRSYAMKPAATAMTFFRANTACPSRRFVDGKRCSQLGQCRALGKNESISS